MSRTNDFAIHEKKASRRKSILKKKHGKNVWVYYTRTWNEITKWEKCFSASHVLKNFFELKKLIMKIKQKLFRHLNYYLSSLIGRITCRVKFQWNSICRLCVSVWHVSLLIISTFSLCDFVFRLKFHAECWLMTHRTHNYLLDKHKLFSRVKASIYRSFLSSLFCFSSHSLSLVYAMCLRHFVNESSLWHQWPRDEREKLQFPFHSVLLCSLRSSKEITLDY